MKTVIVGDVHGCRVELERLLDVTGFEQGDDLVFVGDLMVRGPDSRGVLQVIRQTGARVARGNHDAKLLANRKHPEKLGKAHRAVFDSLDAADWRILEQSAFYVELPAHEVAVVHAGLVPGIPLDEQDVDTLLYIRTVGDGPDAALWGERYVGPPHVVFGHNALMKLQIHPWATGLDTGCVYGGALTALVLPASARVPMARRERLAHLVSVPAERVYFDPKSKG